ncbi:Lrp/AsnC family transcriptional regulator [Candidatus Woesearchaeota archaeon]|nr:Lrp/AsnC family transcriptional regulator [Candidatus Woesearchaeota archaeon]
MFDDKEEKILKELVKNPRISDNQIAKNTGIPVMTVNRKRKKIEEENKVLYFTFINDMTASKARQMYVLKFRSGITRELYINKIKNDANFKEVYSKYVMSSYLGEKDGHLALVMIISAVDESELVEVFNGLIIKSLKSSFGEDAVIEIETTRISVPLRLHNNYLPLINMDKGVIKKGWSDDYISVGKKSDGKLNTQRYLFNYE